MSDPVALCADATACWHEAWLTALGLRSERRGGVWRAIDAPPFIYWAAITVAAHAAEEDVADAHGTVCDAWSRLELDRLGFSEAARDPWFLRPPAPLPREEPPPELVVERVSTPAEVLEFERVSVRGFGGDDAALEAGSLHPAEILGDERMTMLVGRVGGDAIAAATSYGTAEAVGIYGVATVAHARGRGYASALTRALLDPALPAVLSPSAEAERLYRRLGFSHVGELRQWRRS